MKASHRIAAIIIASLCWAPSSFAREDIQSFSIENAMNVAAAQSKLSGDVQFAFGDQSLGAVKRQIGEYKTSKKTNAFGKSDQEACNWAFLSALITLQSRAVTEGGNAVINIRSNYKNNPTSSTTTFECGAGNVIAGVALIGEVVEL